MNRAMRWSLRTDAGLYLAVVALTTALAFVALEAWTADWQVPFTYWGDSLAVAAHFKTALETGWYESQPLLGAPWGQIYHDFPTSDNGNFLAATILGWLTGSWALAMNLYFFIGFPLAALAMAWFLRVVGASRWMTLAIAPLFALLSYHFMRGESHLWLASYFVVPLSLVLVIRVVRGEALWGWGTRRGWRRIFGRGLQTAAIVALTGTMQSYYALFFLIFIAVAGIVALVRDGAWRRFWGAALAGMTTLGVMLLNMLPDTIYSLLTGANPTGFERGHAEAEIWALKLSQLILPWPGHRIGPLAQLRQLYDASYPIPSEQPALGLIGAIGFLCLIGIVLYAAIAGRATSRRGVATPRLAMLTALGGFSLVALLFAMVGGFSTPISFLTTSIRGWNRMVVFIAAFALAGAALLLDAWLARIARRSAERGGRPGLVSRVWAAVIAALVLIVGFVDQTPAGLGAGYAATAEQFRSDESFFRAVQSRLAPGDWVLQLPHQSFPEDQSATGVFGSDVVIPYLHTTEIGWSGGGIKGRPQSDWPAVLEQYPVEWIPSLAATAGASGVLIDTTVITPSTAEIPRALRAQVGDPLVSGDGRYEFWSLADYEPAYVFDDTARAAILDPVTINPRATFQLGWSGAGSPRATAKRPNLSIDLINARDVAVPVMLTLDFELGASLRGTEVTIALTDGTTATASGADEVVWGTWEIVVPPGTSTLAITTATSDGVTVPEVALSRFIALAPLAPTPVVDFHEASLG